MQNIGTRGADALFGASFLPDAPRNRSRPGGRRRSSRRGAAAGEVHPCDGSSQRFERSRSQLLFEVGATDDSFIVAIDMLAINVC